jgi:hypothetical protein
MGGSGTVQKIIVNMERWRWLPRSFERRYIVVNAADQSLDYVSDGRSLLHSPRHRRKSRNTHPDPRHRSALDGRQSLMARTL